MEFVNYITKLPEQKILSKLLEHFTIFKIIY